MIVSGRTMTSAVRQSNSTVSPASKAENTFAPRSIRPGFVHRYLYSASCWPRLLLCFSGTPCVWSYCLSARPNRTPMATMLAGKEIYDEKITALN